MKPGYEVGSSARLLSFAKPVAADPAPAGAADVSSVWQVRTFSVALEDSLDSDHRVFDSMLP